MELQLRRTAASNDFDRPPEHLRRVASAQRLHGRFLGGEAPGEVNRRVPATKTVGDLAFGEDALDEALAVSLDRVLDARDVGGVDAETNDGGHRNPSRA
jgi:hypothetical protein